MIIANPFGALMLLLTIAIMVVAMLVFRINGPFLITIGCIALLVIDLAFRFYRRITDKWLYENVSGGNLFFLPAWSFGLILLIINIVRSRIR
jgi:hypothetical protein